MFRKKHKRLSIFTVELRQIVPSMVIAERKVWHASVQQQPVTWKKYILGWLKESLKNRSVMTMSKLLKTNFMAAVLPFQVIYRKWKKKKCNTNSYMASLTDCESIFQHTKKVFFMYPRETSENYLSTSRKHLPENRERNVKL